MTQSMVSPRSFAHQAWEYECPGTSGVIAGVDGSKESVAALNAAAAIARARHCPLHLVTAISSYPSYQINPGVDSSLTTIEEMRVALKDSELGMILERLEPADDWTHEVRIGRPARALVTAADYRGADLIVVGRRSHGFMDRVLGDETTLQVMRMSSVPVLAVESDLGKPKSIVVAMDFSVSSVRAAHIALDLLGPAGTLYLAYVEPPADVLPAGFAVAGETRFPGDVVVWFRRMIADLTPRNGVLVEPVVLTGRPVAAISDFAEGVGADLIAAGCHGHGRMERFLLGSVSTGLVREARCPVLVTPPDKKR
jgi:nucleotide-binding universal stress UspA family protein